MLIYSLSVTLLDANLDILAPRDKAYNESAKVATTRETFVLVELESGEGATNTIPPDQA